VILAEGVVPEQALVGDQYGAEAKSRLAHVVRQQVGVEADAGGRHLLPLRLE